MGNIFHFFFSVDISYSYVCLPPFHVYILFLVPLSKSGSLQRERRHSVFLYSQSALLHGMEGPADSRPKNHTIGDLAAIHGGPLTSRRRDLRVSMQIPAVQSGEEVEVETEKRKKIEATGNTDKRRPKMKRRRED